MDTAESRGMTKSKCRPLAIDIVFFGITLAAVLAAVWLYRLSFSTDDLVIIIPNQTVTVPNDANRQIVEVQFENNSHRTLRVTHFTAGCNCMSIDLPVIIPAGAKRNVLIDVDLTYATFPLEYTATFFTNPSAGSLSTTFQLVRAPTLASTRVESAIPTTEPSSSPEKPSVKRADENSHSVLLKSTESSNPDRK